MTLIKEIMDWIDKEIESSKGEITQVFSDSIYEEVKYKLKELAKKDLEKYNKGKMFSKEYIEDLEEVVRDG